MTGSTEIVLFGITGDLSRQKLIPALYSLYSKGALKQDSRFFGFGRKKFGDEEFSEFIEACVRSKNAQNADPHLVDTLHQFIKRWTYVASELDDDGGYKRLASLLSSDSSVVFLSLPPAFQLSVCKKLIENGVVEKKIINDAVLSSVMRAASVNEYGRKIALEKPYGHDSTSARELEDFLSSRLNQAQILRVDHYAGKQALVELEAAARQGIFKDLLDLKGIRQIELRILETVDVSLRGAFYDSVGALSDTLQNHLLHMLSTVLVLSSIGPNTPAGDVARLRSKALGGLKLLKGGKSQPILGQYSGFLSISGVREHSVTETFFNVEALVAGVTGKRSGSSIKLRFIGGKALKYAEASVTLTLKNGKEIKISLNGYGTKEAHEQIFEDAVAGNTDRFISFSQVIEGWRFVEQIKKMAMGESGSKLVTYKKGADPFKIKTK